MPSAAGLPVLGVSLPAIRNTREQVESTSQNSPPEPSSAAALEASAERAKRQAQAQQNTNLISVTSDNTPAERPQSPGLLRAGVGLAYALAFTCLLPDLTAAFQAAGGRKRRTLRWGHFRRWFRRS